MVSLGKVADLAAVQAALRAVDIGGTDFHDPSGFGRLDALASVEAVVAPQCAGDDECADGDARLAIIEFIEGWYNPHRRHSALDYLSPINYERSHSPMQ